MIGEVGLNNIAQISSLITNEFYKEGTNISIHSDNLVLVVTINEKTVQIYNWRPRPVEQVMNEIRKFVLTENFGNSVILHG